jgi:hypothetical protein
MKKYNMRLDVVSLLVFVIGVALALIFVLGSSPGEFRLLTFGFMLIPIINGGGSIAAMWGVLSNTDIPWKHTLLVWILGLSACMDPKCLGMAILPILLQIIITGCALLVMCMIDYRLTCEMEGPSSLAKALLCCPVKDTDINQSLHWSLRLCFCLSAIVLDAIMIALLWHFLPREETHFLQDMSFAKPTVVFAAMAVALVEVWSVIGIGWSLWTTLAFLLILAISEVVIGAGTPREELTLWCGGTFVGMLWLLIYLTVLDWSSFRIGRRLWASRPLKQTA